MVRKQIKTKGDVLTILAIALAVVLAYSLVGAYVLH